MQYTTKWEKRYRGWSCRPYSSGVGIGDAGMMG